MSVRAMILDTLAHGEASFTHLVHATASTSDTVGAALDYLRRRGLVERPARGRYRLPTRDDARAA